MRLGPIGLANHSSVGPERLGNWSSVGRYSVDVSRQPLHSALRLRLKSLKEVLIYEQPDSEIPASRVLLQRNPHPRSRSQLDR